MAMHQRPEKLTTHLPTSDIREKNQSELQQHQSTPVIIMSSDDASASPASEQSNNPKSNPPPSQVAAIAAATSRASAAVSTTATPKDVVGGRGKNTRLHPGNLFYTKLLKEWYDEYKQAPKGSKMDICKCIIALVNEQGGRFLEKVAGPAVSLSSASSVSSTSSLYTELEEEQVIAKVAQGFRDLKVNKEKSTVGNSSWNGGASSVISKQSKKKFGKKGFISPLARTIVAAPPAIAAATSRASVAVSTTATPNDVVGGRGKNTRLHPGNLFYTKLLKERYDEYKQAPKGSKMDICKRIIALVNEQGGRFLEKAAAPAVSLSASTVSSTSSLYTELEEERVIAKVAQGFRDLKVNKEKSTVGNSSWNGGASSVISKQSKKKFGKKGFISPLGRTIVAAPPVSSVAVTAAAAAAAATEHNKNGTLSAQQQQPRRMSFTERAKLFQKEQEKLLRIQRGEDVSSDDEDEEEEASDDDEEEGDDDAASDQEDAANANEAKNDNKLPPSGVRFPTYGEGEDVSDTETEDSFPMYRGDKKSG